MEAMKYLSVFRAYGVDVLLLALGVTLFTSLLKKTVMKNCPKKVFVFLPFAIGIVIYAVYRALVTLSAAPFTSELAKTVEGGFACGCAATLYYCIYEQFLRTKSVQNPLTPLLEIIPEELREAAARELTEKCKGKPREELALPVEETLKAYAPEASDADVKALSRLLCAYLAVITADS